MYSPAGRPVNDLSCNTKRTNSICVTFLNGKPIQAGVTVNSVVAHHRYHMVAIIIATKIASKNGGIS